MRRNPERSIRPPRHSAPMAAGTRHLPADLRRGRDLRLRPQASHLARPVPEHGDGAGGGRDPKVWTSRPPRPGAPHPPAPPCRRRSPWAGPRSSRCATASAAPRCAPPISSAARTSASRPRSAVTTASCRSPSRRRPASRRRPSPRPGPSRSGTARVQAGKRKIIKAQRHLEFRVRRLHDELRRIDAKLVKLMPIVYHGILRFDAPNGNLPGRSSTDGPPPVPETGTVYGLNIAYERVALLDALSEVCDEVVAVPDRPGRQVRQRDRDAHGPDARRACVQVRRPRPCPRWAVCWAG